MSDLLLRKTARVLISGIVRSCRMEVRGLEAISEIRNTHKPLLFIFWHRHIFTLIHQFRNSGARPLISHSSDGDLVARVAREFGLNPIRGSSSRGGAAAFLTMMRSLSAADAEVLITADGPKGPARKLKPGTVELARRTGAWLIPVSWYSRPVKVFNRSWDRFLLPLPFARIILSFGDPVSPLDLKEMTRDEGDEFMRLKLNDLEASLKNELYGKRYSEEKT